jgi:chemotaxis protein CheD
MLNAVPGGTLTNYYDSAFKRQVVKIKPGEFFATTHHYIIATVLGSCVSACIRDAARGSGGMNHFMLPDEGTASAPSLSSSRYGVFAMETLINEFVKRGSARRDLEAKVFGGAAVVEALRSDIGAQNAQFVIDYLAVEGIRTTAVDLGGLAPRKVMYFVEDGTVLVKYLWRLTNDTIERREEEYARAISFAPPLPAVELF